MINASECDAQFEQHRKVRLIDETYCSCVCLLVFHVDLCGRAVHDLMVRCTQTQMIHIDVRSLVVRNPGQLDRKHTRL